MADADYARSAGMALDRLVTLTFQYNFRRVKGQDVWDLATRPVFARREFIRATDQLDVLPEGVTYSPNSFWIVRADDHSDPPVKVDDNRRLWITDDEGRGWRVLGVQPIGRRRHLQLYAIATTSRTPVPTA